MAVVVVRIRIVACQQSDYFDGKPSKCISLTVIDNGSGMEGETLARHEAAPSLTRFANSSPIPFVNIIKAAREKNVARSDDDRSKFLRKRERYL